jgi:hypothetical protein
MNKSDIILALVYMAGHQFVVRDSVFGTAGFTSIRFSRNIGREKVYFFYISIFRLLVLCFVLQIVGIRGCFGNRAGSLVLYSSSVGTGGAETKIT